MALNHLRRPSLWMLSTTAFTAFAVPAFAQSDTQPAPAASTSPPAEAKATVSEAPGDIIVTARRRNETLQTTPVAITAVNTAMLENKAAVNIGDLQGAAPGLLITQQNSGAQAANLSIRGLTYADIEKSQTPTVGVVVDGVTIGTNTGQLQDAFDIEQIEVLRGPQGTLFGANTIGGVILINRTKPTMEPGVRAEFTYGQWNTWDGKVVFNTGNGTSFGIKTFYFHNQSDGFYYNATSKTSDGGSKGDTYGISALFQPVGSGFDAQFTIENVVQSFVPTVSNITNSSELFCQFEPADQCNRNTTTDLYTTFGSPALSRYKAPDATLTLNYDAGVVKLTSITGWRHSSEQQTQDFDGSSVDLYYVDRRQHYTQWSQELRASGNIVRGLDYVVGGYYFGSDYDLTQWTRLFGFDPSIPPTVADPNPQFVKGETTSYAAFADFNWAFANHFRLSFGGRWSHDEKKLTNSFAQTGLIGSGDANFSKFTPKVGIDWRPTDDVMLYASWSRGYRSGGFSPRAATAETASTPFEPETVDAYEIGTKLALFDRKLDLNLAGYVSDYKNMQQNLTVPGGPTGNQTITGNVPGGALIKGIEMDATLHVIQHLNVTASAAYMESHFRNFVTCGAYSADLPIAANSCGDGLVPFDYSHNRLIYAPKFTSSLNAEYTLPTSFGSVVPTFGWRHISPYDEQISQASLTPTTDSAGNVTSVTVNGNDPRVRTVTQDLIDASLTFNFEMGGKKVYARVFGRNLADIRTTTAAFTVAGLFSFASALEPRTYGGTIGINF
jgi:iron complex outermembrane receptor protein